MEAQRNPLYFFATVLAAALAGGAYFAYLKMAPSPQRVAGHIVTWLDSPKTTMKLMTESYGPPSALAPGTAIWRDRGPWKRIVVHGYAPEGYLEQTVGYSVPRSAVAALNEFGHGVRVDLADDELSAASGDESLNRLALNLAVQIAVGKRSAADAREFYAKTVRLAAAGKSSPYLAEILFAPYEAAPTDPRRRGVGY